MCQELNNICIINFEKKNRFLYAFIQLAKFHAEIERKREQQAEKDRKRCEELQAQLAEQAKFDEERFVELLL